jgi:hypothetical protein
VPDGCLAAAWTGKFAAQTGGKKGRESPPQVLCEGRFTLQKGLAARYLESQQGERRAAKLPDLKEDPWLNMLARREAYCRIIAHYQKLLASVENKLAQTPLPPNIAPTLRTYTSKPDEKFTWPSYVTAIGLTVLPDALERTVLIRTNQPLNDKDEAALKPATKKRAALPKPQR